MKRLILTAIAAVMATNAMATGSFQSGGGTGPFMVTDVMLGIKSPATNACPAKATMKAWITTTKAGQVSYMTIRHGQGASPVQTVMAKKVGDRYVAEISRTLSIHHPIDTQYRIAARGQGDYEFSNWVPLKANCSIGLGGGKELIGG